MRALCFSFLLLLPVLLFAQLPFPFTQGPPEGSWTRGPVLLRTDPGPEGQRVFLRARLLHESGMELMIYGEDSLEIRSLLGEYTEVLVEARIEDPWGSLSEPSYLSFTIDPNTLYVAPYPQGNAWYPPASAVYPSHKGGRDAPFPSLEEALLYAAQEDLTHIWIGVEIPLEGPLVIDQKIIISGLGGAALLIPPGSGFLLSPGASLGLQNLRIERLEGLAPLIVAGPESELHIRDTDMYIVGPLLLMEGGQGEIRNSRIQILLPTELEIPAISGTKSSLDIRGSQIQLEGFHSLLVDLQGGSLFGGDSIFYVLGRRSASVLSIKDGRGDFSNLLISAAAQDFAGALRAQDSEILYSDGIIEVFGLETEALFLDQSPALFAGTLFEVAGDLGARAARVQGIFPRFLDCRLFYSGSAPRAEVFTGQDSPGPALGSISGNRFSGFTHLWDSPWPLSELAQFNQAYADPQRPNEAPW